MIDREFYGTGAGERYFEQLTHNAQAQASSVYNFFYDMAIAYQASKELPKLEASRDELRALVQDAKKRMSELDELLTTKRLDGDTRIKLQAERDGLAARYTQDNRALTQVEIVLRSLGTLREPIAPVWLTEWMQDTYRR